MHYDVAIIGAGLSGLAAGIRCAHYDKRVVVLEKHSVWGGLNSFYKKGGHHFDTGLHAVTNWVRPGYKGPRLPLQRILRQLRIRPEEFALEPQTQSRVVFDDAQLTFDNDIERLTESVRQTFPAQIDNWSRLVDLCSGYPEPTGSKDRRSSRAVVEELITDRLLVEMVLCPIFFYGSAEEDDLDFEQFQILFNSLFREGFCRPRRGIRQILDVLVKRFQGLGGQLRRKTAVERLVVEDGRVRAVEVDGGEAITADFIVSSAGRVETDALRTDRDPNGSRAIAGQLGFVESLWVLDVDPRARGFEDCVVFFNRGPEFAWRKPTESVDLNSGVICVPSNYQHAEPATQYLIRATHLANHEHWFGFDEATYRAAKDRWSAASKDVVAKYGADFSDRVVYFDGFTPRTVRHYTSHVNGAIYGSPHKVKSGTTDVENLFLCGTDQGMVGVVGAMLSGINMANLHILSEGATR